MKISVNKAHFPVTVLGPGRRLGVWLQGCRIRCPGCVSRDTWEPDRGREMPVSDLLAWCRASTGGVFDGVTISGGEPFDQSRALSAFLDGLIGWRATGGPDFDILCYSGYPFATLKKRYARLLEKLDALIPEPYLESLPLTRVWRGSSNQSLQLLTPRGRERYAAHLEAPAATLGKRIQVGVDGERLWFVGIPGRGDMAALEAACRERGIELARMSWKQ